MRTSLLLVLALLGTGFSQARAEEDGPAAREQVAKRSAAALAAKDWDKLEDMAGDFRRTKARFLDGHWKLSVFYDGLSPRRLPLKQQHWDETLAALQEWKAAYPESITARVAIGETLTGYAWQARGGGYANTVTPEGWELLEARLAQARTALEEGDRLAEKCPEWFRAMQSVGLGQSWPREEYEELYRAAVAFEPTYPEYYFSKGYYLLPRWNGEEGEWVRYAEETAQKDDPGEGLTMYARICWSNADYTDDLFGNGGADWAKMKQGFLDLQKAFPHSLWNLNNFAKFAVRAGDKATAKELMARIGPQAMAEAWKTMSAYESALAWAYDVPQAKTRAILKMEAPVSTLAYSPDGQLLAAGSKGGALTVWETAKYESVWSPLSQGQPVPKLVFSPDGQMLAAAVGAWQSNEPGKAQLWNVSSRRLLKTVDDWAKPVLAVAFNADGKKLWMSASAAKGGPQTRVLEIASGKLSEHDWKTNEQTASMLAISPQDTMAVYHHQYIDVLDLASLKNLTPVKTKVGGWVQDLAFSPDGAALAVAIGIPTPSHGGVTIFNAKNWQAPTRKIDIEERTYAVAFSPDGRVLATGGLDTVIRLFDIRDGRLLANFRGHTQSVHDLAYSPDGATLASCSEDGTVRLWDAATRNVSSKTTLEAEAPTVK